MNANAHISRKVAEMTLAPVSFLESYPTGFGKNAGHRMKNQTTTGAGPFIEIAGIPGCAASPWKF